MTAFWAKLFDRESPRKGRQLNGGIEFFGQNPDSPESAPALPFGRNQTNDRFRAAKEVFLKAKTEPQAPKQTEYAPPSPQHNHGKLCLR